jgi:hypothetical protein
MYDCASTDYTTTHIRSAADYSSSCIVHDAAIRRLCRAPFEVTRISAARHPFFKQPAVEHLHFERGELKIP